jgi:ParB family chromosome partitioning protein
VSKQKRGLGRGLGALIPTAPKPGEPGAPSGPSPVDVLIPERPTVPDETADTAGAPGDGGDQRDSSAARDTRDPGDSLTPDSQQLVGGSYFAEVPIDSVVPNPRQPRQVFDEDAMAELVHSIREVGLLQPVVVRPIGADRYELIMGERRLRAARDAGLTELPAIVRATGDDVMLRDALLENLHRAQLNPLEEANAYDQLLQDFDCTHDELAHRIGRSRPQISNTLRLLKLPALVQRRIAAGVLSAGHARALLGLEDAGAQERLAQRIVAEGLSVRSVEEIVSFGAEETPERPRRSKAPVAPKLEVLASRLGDRFETRVKVDLGKSKGRITVEFASIDDLERIVALMDPDGTAADLVSRSNALSPNGAGVPES